MINTRKVHTDHDFLSRQYVPHILRTVLHDCAQVYRVHYSVRIITYVMTFIECVFARRIFFDLVT